MPRAPRTDVADLVYHVLNRANARAPLFDCTIDYRCFARLLAEERARMLLFFAAGTSDIMTVLFSNCF